MPRTSGASQRNSSVEIATREHIVKESSVETHATISGEHTCEQCEYIT